MQYSKLVNVPIPVGVKLSAEQNPRHKKKKSICPVFHMQVQWVA